MMKKLTGILLLLPVVFYGQVNRTVNSVKTGIQFEQGVTWEQIVQKAKQEKKFIFVDCYASWCVPCKKMDKEVYPLEKVGALLNDNFISVKMQMDTTQSDDEAVKALYADAYDIAAKYKVQGYPTYLFFTPDGKLLSRDEGLKEPDDFIAVAKDVTDPSKNYYTVLEKFVQGKTGADETSWLARRAKLLADTTASDEIARNYILHLNKDSLLTKPNLQFMQQFTRTSADKGFQLFYNHAKEIDSIMLDDTYAEGAINPIIYKELVVPELQKVKLPGKPNWDAIQLMIRKKYNDYYAERVTIAARSSWALKQSDIKQYTKYLVQFQDKFGSKTNTDFWTSLTLNNYAWEIFQDSNDPVELQHALSWSGRAVLMAPGARWMDTYANILYKLGHTEEALDWEKIAAKLSPDDKDIKAALQKMENNEPTWQMNKK